MTEFIDCYPDALEKEKTEARRLGERIVALLEHASENLTRQTRLPSKVQAAELKEDLDDKRRELKASEMTADRLSEELALRQTELEKVQSLEGKLSAELRALDDRMRAMDGERPKFADVEGLRAAADRARAELRARIDEHTQRRDAARPAGAAAERELTAKRAALKALPQALLLEAAEGQLKNSEAAVFALRENIGTIGRDSDFEPVKNEVSTVLIELNIILSKLAADVAAGIVM
jgi:intraflagellar transport protein 74